MCASGPRTIKELLIICSSLKKYIFLRFLKIHRMHFQSEHLCGLELINNK
jgi:hypothetical protein